MSRRTRDAPDRSTAAHSPSERTSRRRPPKVMFRNELMELLQYEPQTDTVHATPLLCSPPWINKYYIMDLAPDRSFIEWAIRHNRTVFAISYRNPTKEMYRTTMDDYLVSGPRQALDVISEVTGSPKIDIAGLCLGGALTAITAAYLTQTGDDRVGNVTLLNTMLDYSEPGMLGVFTDEAAVDRVEKAMAKAGGTLEGESMAGTFDIMRANDLIFNYVVSNWLLGQDPPAFDILAWNNDSTKMPGRCTRSISGISTSGTCLPRGNSKLRVRRSTSPRSSRTPTWSARRTITSCRGSRRTRPPNCSPEQRDSSSAMAGISLESSTRPARSRGFCPRTTTLPRPTSGCPPLQRTPESWWVDWAKWSAEHAGAMTSPPQTGLRDASRARPRTRHVRLHLRAVAALGRRAVTDPRLGPAPAAAAEARCRFRRRAGEPCAG